MKLRDLTGKQVLIGVCVIVLIVILLAALPASAQGVGGVEVPTDPDFWGVITDGALAIIGAVLLWMMRGTLRMAPALIREWIDAKRQRDLHSAVMSKVAELMKQGRWPTAADARDLGGDIADILKPEIVEEIRGYITEFSPQAGKWADLETWSKRGEALLRTLSSRMAKQLEKPDPLTPVLQAAMRASPPSAAMRLMPEVAPAEAPAPQRDTELLEALRGMLAEAQQPRGRPAPDTPGPRGNRDEYPGGAG